MASKHSGHVIAGVDGSEAAARALEFGAVEADLRGTPLEVVCAVDVSPIPFAGSDTATASAITQTRNQVDRLVTETRECHPGLPVAGAVLLGRASDVLVNHSAVGQLLVVGARGRPTPERLLLGSVSLAVAAHATCPVVVVHERIEEPERIVVGTDGSATATAAVEFAFEEAERRALPLEVVSVVDPSMYGVAWFWAMMPPLDDLDRGAADAVEQEVGPLRSRHPEVSVRTDVVVGRPASVLIERTAPNTLLVVGSRGRGALRGTLLGSVSQNVLHHTNGPTVIVHPSGRGDVEQADLGRPEH